MAPTNKRSGVPLKLITFDTTPNHTEILDKYAVMEILHISERTLKTYVKEGYLPYSQIRGKSYYTYTDLLEMLAKHKVRG